LETIKKIFNKLKQFMKFGIVGVINTLVYFGVYYGLLFLGVSHIISNIVAYFIGSINGYLWSRGWVFKEAKASVKSSVLKYYVVYGSSLLLSTGVIYLLVDIIGISDKIAPLLTMCVTIPYNFFFQKIWAFRTKRKEENEEEEIQQENK